MILDTTYLLPLAQVAINNDILASIARRNIDVKLEDISVSLISIFELQAKSAKLNLPAKPVIRAVDAITSAFNVVPFHEPEVIEISLKTRKMISDYVDCIIISTAVWKKEDLITEDSLIHEKKTKILREFNLKVLAYADLVRT